MVDFLIYTKSNCPFCVKAKDLLKSKNFSFEERDIADYSDEQREELFEKCSGMKTVPQIFDLRDKENIHCGGFTDLKAFFEKQ